MGCEGCPFYADDGTCILFADPSECEGVAIALARLYAESIDLAYNEAGGRRDAGRVGVGAMRIRAEE